MQLLLEPVITILASMVQSMWPTAESWLWLDAPLCPQCLCQSDVLAIGALDTLSFSGTAARLLQL